MKDIKSLTFFRSFYEAIKNLNEKQRLLIYDAIFEYQFEEKNINFEDKILQSFWLLIQPNIDASNSKKLAGAKGGRPKKSKQKASFLKNKNLAFQKSKSEEEEEVEEEEEEEVESEGSAFCASQKSESVMRILSQQHKFHSS